MAKAASPTPEKEKNEPLEAQNLVAKFKEDANVRLTQIREYITPLIDEEAELAPMIGEKSKFVEASASPAPAAPVAPVAPPVPSSVASGEPKKRRTRKGGTRADQAVSLVTEKPGIGASAIASEMGIAPNYLYRVLGDLEKEGRVRKDGRQYYPAAA